MTTQEENELIAERLLCWKRIGGIRWDDGKGGCGPAVDERFFTDWSSAGLIADAFAARGIEFDILYSVEERHWEASTWEDDGFGGADMTVDEHDASGPLAIRLAALAYLRGAT